ncbi:MAG: type II toxin-antitoxin system VapC family toxin [Candidatus Micrarchaeota archaeon]|nr:type II toxin-antitoxin system VapC family toxin [Candidatus Micrarchaeota archaeon]
MDTSAIVKRYIPEEGSDAIDSVYNDAQIGEHNICFSILNIGEVTGVLGKYERKNKLKEESIVKSFADETARMKNSGSVEIVSVDDELVINSLQYVVRHHIYIVDALQITSCRKSGSIRLFTGDENLYKASKKEGLDSVYLK